MPLGLGKGAGHHLTENSLPFMFPPSLACLREMLLLLLSLLSNTVVFCFALAMETHKKKRDFLMISIFRCICLPEYPRAYSYWEWGRGRGKHTGWYWSELHIWKTVYSLTSLTFGWFCLQKDTTCALCYFILCFSNTELNPVRGFCVCFGYLSCSFLSGGLLTITSAWYHTDSFCWNPVKWS